MRHFSSFIFFCIELLSAFYTHVWHLHFLYIHPLLLHTQRIVFFQKTVSFPKISHHSHLNNTKHLETQYMNKITFEQIQISSVNYAWNRKTYSRIQRARIEQDFPS
jgi:hypothetical protein